MIAADKKELLRLPGLATQVVNSTGAGDAALLAQKAGAVTCRSESANAPELANILD